MKGNGTLKPLAANVLIVPARGEYTQAREEQKTEAGNTGLVAVAAGRVVAGSAVLRPETEVGSKPSEGIVRAIGPDVTLTITEGDRVLYRSWTGIECRIREAGQEDWVDHQLTPQRDVLAIVEQDERVEVIMRPVPQPQSNRRVG